MAETMIERVASAMYLAEYGEEDQHGMPMAQWNARSAGEKSKYLRLARAAMLALRDPSDIVLDRGVFTHGLSSRVGVDRHWARCAWNAMLDEALGRPEENPIFRDLFKRHQDRALRSDQENADGHKDRPK